MCHPHVNRKFAVMRIAAATPRGTRNAETVKISMEMPCTITESMTMARNRLPAPAGSRRMCTCSGVMISSERVIGPSQKQIRHQSDEQQHGHGDLECIGKRLRRELRERAFD